MLPLELRRKLLKPVGLDFPHALYAIVGFMLEHPLTRPQPIGLHVTTNGDVFIREPNGSECWANEVSAVETGLLHWGLAAKLSDAELRLWTSHCSRKLFSCGSVERRSPDAAKAAG